MGTDDDERTDRFSLAKIVDFLFGHSDFRIAFIIKLLLYIICFNHIPNGGILDSPLLNRYPLFLKRREARQLETTQHFDKALKCSCFDTIKKSIGTLGKKWGHAK